MFYFWLGFCVDSEQAQLFWFDDLGGGEEDLGDLVGGGRFLGRAESAFYC